ncbi:MAG: alpha/beta hydrolase [Terriglobia bacterium]
MRKIGLHFFIFFVLVWTPVRCTPSQQRVTLLSSAPTTEAKQHERKPTPMETLVQFKNRNGKWLRGMIHWPNASTHNGPVPGVIFYHGFTGDRIESHWIFVKCARALAEAGIASLRFDFYGSGESEGTFREMSLQGEIADAEDAIAFLRKQKGIASDRIGLSGLSLGGTVAASVAGSGQARALVLWSAVAHTDRLRSAITRTGKAIPDARGNLEYDAREISAQALEEMVKVNPLTSLASFKGPTLILQAGNDAVVPLSDAEDFLDSAGAAVKEKVIIAGANHTYTSIAWENEVIQRTVAWFKKYLSAN